MRGRRSGARALYRKLDRYEATLWRRIEAPPRERTEIPQQAFNGLYKPLEAAERRFDELFPGLVKEKR